MAGGNGNYVKYNKKYSVCVLSFVLTCSQCDYNHYIYIFGSFEGRYNSLYILLFLLCLTSVAYRYIMRIFYLMRLDYAKILLHKGVSRQITI